MSYLFCQKRSQIIEAFNDLKKNDPDIQLYLVGGYKEDEYYKIAANYKM